MRTLSVRLTPSPNTLKHLNPRTVTRCALHAQSQEGVRTLSVRMGIPRVFWACIGMLEAAYIGAICMGLASQARTGT